MSTAENSEPMFGDKEYQKLAREALPLLVRQAHSGTPIYYSYLAEELGMPNPRNLNYVLGSIGQSIEKLSKTWNSVVPPIQCLVITKKTGLPGSGIGWFLVKQEDFSKLPTRQKRSIVEAELNHIFSYPSWNDVLSYFHLLPSLEDFSNLIAETERIGGFAGGESDEHKMLKEFVANNPKSIHLETSQKGKTECRLPSGDSLDVSFRDKGNWVAAEVKSAISNGNDIVRGIFQCVKYRAVMEAVLLAEGCPQNARALLVLESQFPPALIPLRNILGVEVVSGVSPSGKR